MLLETHIPTDGLLSPAAPPPLERLIGRKEVLILIGISNATLWRWIKAGRFPAPMKIGKKKVAWRSSVLATWVAQRSVARRGPEAPAMLGELRSILGSPRIRPWAGRTRERGHKKRNGGLKRSLDIRSAHSASTFFTILFEKPY